MRQVRQPCNLQLRQPTTATLYDLLDGQGDNRTMKVDNQTTRNARKAGEITQAQARRLLDAAEDALILYMPLGQPETAELRAAIHDITGDGE